MPSSRAQMWPMLVVSLIGLLLVVAGCGGGDDAEGATQDETSTATGTALPSTDSSVPDSRSPGPTDDPGTDDASTPPTTPTTPESPESPDDSAGDGDGNAAGAALDAELTEVFTKLAEPGLSPRQRAAQIVDGEDLVPTLRELGPSIGAYVSVLEVTSSVADGSRARADVDVTDGSGAVLTTVVTTFALVDDVWHLDRRGACALVDAAGSNCP